MVSAFPIPMSKKTVRNVCLVLGLTAFAWSAWPDRRDGAVQASSGVSSSASPSSNGFVSWLPAPLAKFAQSFTSNASNSPTETMVAAPMSESEVATANPDAPPAANSTDQEAAQAESLMQAGGESFQQPVPSRLVSGASSRTQAPGATDPSSDLSNVPVVALPQTTDGKKSAHGGSTSSSSSTSSSTSSTGLKNEDYVALLSPLKASFEDRMAEAFGSVCSIDTQICAQPSKSSVHSLRWSQEEGLNRHVAFAIKSIGPALQFDLSIRIQKSTTNEESASLNLTPLSIDAQNETVNGKSLRVIDFRFGDFQIRGETMNNVHAKMVFESTEAGLVPTGDSRFEFNRSKVGIAMSKWEPDAVVTASTDPTLPSFPDIQNLPVWSEEDYGRKPSSESGSYLLADDLLFSIKIEKS
jgi:hypothetical protein